MNLFSNIPTTLRDEFKTSLREWSDILPLETLERVKTTLAAVKNRSTLAKVYPEPQDIFKIYQNLKLEDIKVVILGQDPYHDGNAMGYAFGCKINPSPSLKHILNAMQENNIEQDTIKKDIQLEYLVKQGVFLLNTCLTVEAGNPKSHEYLGWQDFTRDTIIEIAQKNKNVVWLLWGKSAQNYYDTIMKYTINGNMAFGAEHPAAAAHRNERWVCNHFSKANNYLIQHNIKPIQWL